MTTPDTPQAPAPALPALAAFPFPTALVVTGRSAAGDGVLLEAGEVDEVFPFASVTKPIVAWAALASANHTDRAVLDYVAALAEATRDDESSLLGVSTRGAIGMVRCARVWAAAQGRNFVLPDDIKALAVPVWAHRIIVDPDAAFSGATAEGVIQRALTSVPAPAVGA